MPSSITEKEKDRNSKRRLDFLDFGLWLENNDKFRDWLRLGCCKLQSMTFLMISCLFVCQV